MATATPDTLGDVLGQLIQAAADEAAAQPAMLQQVLDQAGRTLADTVDTVTEMPADALAALQRIVDPPDWWSLLTFVLVQVAKLDAKLSVGTMLPAGGWSRAVTLTYTDPGPPARAVTVGLALTDPGRVHGLTLDATGPLTVSPLGTGGTLTVSISTDAEVHWRIPFTGGFTAPAQSAVLDAAIGWDPRISVGDEIAHVSVGAAKAAVRLSFRPGDPLWGLRLSIGDPAGAPGAEAVVDLGRALGALGGLVHIGAVDERYSPSLVLAPGTAPQFSLGSA